MYQYLKSFIIIKVPFFLNIQIVLLDGPVIDSSCCSCTIGKSGHCGHVIGLLYSLAHTKSSNLRFIPSDVLKTSLPQTWHVPRGEKISGSAADNVVVYGYDVKSPQRQSRGLKSTVYNPLNSALLPVSQLYSSVSQVDSTCLLLSVVNVKDEGSFINTKFGKFSKGSPLAVQQKLSPHYVLNILDAADFPLLPVTNVMVHEVQLVLTEKKSGNFTSIFVTAEECHQIEEMTRLQSESPKWHALRRERLTASVAGEIVNRRAGKKYSAHML